MSRRLGVAAVLLMAVGCATVPRVRSGEEGHQRAGSPHEVSAHAQPSDDGGYIGYRVGGGATAGRGEGPTLDQGTWGWDYAGWKFPSFVTLGWWNGKRQGGEGAYRTDGPRPVERFERRHE